MTIIQSTYLMSYHLGGINADRGPWYLIGIAINLAYGAGLHRLSPCELQTCPTCHSRQWAQLWWSIYCREAWLSLAYNRPMRIQLDEVSTTVPTQVEVASICIDIFDERYHKYLPREIDDLVSMWLYLVRISLTLSDILSKLNASESSGPTQQPINYTEDDVGAHLCGLSDESLGSELIKVHLYQLRLYREYAVFRHSRPNLGTNFPLQNNRDYLIPPGRPGPTRLPVRGAPKIPLEAVLPKIACGSTSHYAPD